MNLSKKYKYIVFTDTHLPVENRKEEFLHFLETLERTASLTENIILLGDIFEVWCGVSYYNHKRGKILLEKIKEIQKQTNVILIEGNWDFFLCKHFKNYFSTCRKKFIKTSIGEKNTIFTHGHLFGDWQTRVLHFILINPISYLAWKTGLLKKLEIKIARKFLNKETNPLPNDYDLKKAAQNLEKKFKKSDLIVCGHFHKEEKHGKVVFLKDYLSSKNFYGFTEKNIEKLWYKNGKIETGKF